MTLLTVHLQHIGGKAFFSSMPALPLTIQAVTTTPLKKQAAAKRGAASHTFDSPLYLWNQDIAPPTIFRSDSSFHSARLSQTVTDARLIYVSLHMRFRA